MDTDTLDISATLAPKSDQLNADDFLGGREIIAAVERVKVRKPTGTEQPLDVFLVGHKLPYRPCLSMRRVLAELWGTDSKVWVGRTLHLYRDPAVRWGGAEVGGIRIKAMSHLRGPYTMALTVTKGVKQPYRIEVIRDAGPAAPSPWSTFTATMKKANLDADRIAEWWRARTDNTADPVKWSAADLTKFAADVVAEPLISDFKKFSGGAS